VWYAVILAEVSRAGPRLTVAAAPSARLVPPLVATAEHPKLPWTR